MDTDALDDPFGSVVVDPEADPETTVSFTYAGYVVRVDSGSGSDHAVALEVDDGPERQVPPERTRPPALRHLGPGGTGYAGTTERRRTRPEGSPGARIGRESVGTGLRTPP